MTAYDRVRRVIVQQAASGGFACSVPDLARLARCSTRSVQYVLHALRDEDEIVLTTPSRQHYPARYALAGSLAAEVSARLSGRHLGVVPATQPGVQLAPLPEAQTRGDYRGVTNRTRARAARRCGLRAEGTNPRARAAARAEMVRHRDAGSVCPDHLTERNGAGVCSGCRADQLAVGVG